MPATNISPNTDNYYSGKGVMKFKKSPALTYRDIGDVPDFEITPNVTRMEHYSSRSGVRVKDQSLVAQRQLTCRIIMDEFTADNLALTLMSPDPVAGVLLTDHYLFTGPIMSQAEIIGAVRFIGKNAVGAMLQIDLPTVTFAPGTAIKLIQEQYGTLEVTGEVAANPSTQSFGTYYWGIDQEIAP